MFRITSTLFGLVVCNSGDGAQKKTLLSRPHEANKTETKRVKRHGDTKVLLSDDADVQTKGSSDESGAQVNRQANASVKKRDMKAVRKARSEKVQKAVSKANIGYVDISMVKWNLFQNIEKMVVSSNALTQDVKMENMESGIRERIDHVYADLWHYLDTNDKKHRDGELMMVKFMTAKATMLQYGFEPSVGLLEKAYSQARDVASKDPSMAIETFMGIFLVELNKAFLEERQAPDDGFIFARLMANAMGLGVDYLRASSDYSLPKQERQHLTTICGSHGNPRCNGIREWRAGALLTSIGSFVTTCINDKAEAVRPEPQEHSDQCSRLNQKFMHSHFTADSIDHINRLLSEIKDKLEYGADEDEVMRLE